MIALIIAIVLITAYLLTTIAVFKEVPVSISNTHYLYSQRFKNGDLIFPSFMTCTALLILPTWITISPDGIQWLVFLSCAGMLFVGAAAFYQERLTKIVHYTAATVWAMGAVVWLLIQGHLAALAIGCIFGTVGVMATGERAQTFFAEVACITAIVVGLIMEMASYEC